MENAASESEEFRRIALEAQKQVKQEQSTIAELKVKVENAKPILDEAPHPVLALGAHRALALLMLEPVQLALPLDVPLQIAQRPRVLLNAAGLEPVAQRPQQDSAVVLGAGVHPGGAPRHPQLAELDGTPDDADVRRGFVATG